MSSFLQALESRQLFSSYTLSSDGLLTIVGTKRADFIKLYSIKDSYALDLDGKVRAAYKKKQIKGVVMWGNEGGDRLTISNIGVPCTIIGGEGRDTITGGSKDDILVGGPGKDSISGKGGNDILRGDLGDDGMNGGSGDDILFGGPGKNTLTGAEGNDTVLVTAGVDDTKRTKSIEVSQPDTFRPVGRLFPEASSYISPALTQITSPDNDVLATLTYTQPTAGTQLLFQKLDNQNDLLLRSRSTGEGSRKQTVLQLPILVLSLGGDPAAPQQLAASVPSSRLASGQYAFALASVEDPSKSKSAFNDYVFNTRFEIAPPTTTT